MNQYPPHLSSADVWAVALIVLAMTLLLVLVLSMSEPSYGGVSEPMTAPAGLGL
jgi:hypothetical protein